MEQFEERILNKRAGYLYNAIKSRISVGTVTTFSDVIWGNDRKQVRMQILFPESPIVFFFQISTSNVYVSLAGCSEVLLIISVEETQNFRIDARRTVWHD